MIYPYLGEILRHIRTGSLINNSYIEKIISINYEDLISQLIIYKIILIIIVRTVFGDMSIIIDIFSLLN